MGKKSTVLYKLVSSAGTGFFYVGEKNTKFKNYLGMLLEN